MYGLDLNFPKLQSGLPARHVLYVTIVVVFNLDY